MTRKRKSKAPALTEVTMTGLVGGEVKVETMDDLWNWADCSDDVQHPPGVALTVTSALDAEHGREGQTAALSLVDLDNLIDELTKARDIVRKRSGGAR